MVSIFHYNLQINFNNKEIVLVKKFKNKINGFMKGFFRYLRNNYSDGIGYSLKSERKWFSHKFEIMVYISNFFTTILEDFLISSTAPSRIYSKKVHKIT